jgi:predicted short-subunit dehydrogenase-like oxidoreductase (DUF2520 family)
VNAVRPDYPITVAGRGNLGRSLARALHARLVPGREGFELPRRGILFLAVPDAAVSAMAERIAALRPPRQLAVVHVSGALGLDVLEALKDNPKGSFHPLQPFPAPRDPSAFHGITVAIAASSPALERRLGALARKLGARPRPVSDAQRALYHASAAFASNFVHVVVAKAAELLGGVGWSEEESLAALMPLVEGQLANIRKLGPVRGLTGPIRRGDAATVERHLGAIDGREQAAVYRMLGLVALEIAKEAGLEPAAAERTRRALTRKVAATRRRRS